jgi:hypothetical protein
VSIAAGVSAAVKTLRNTLKDMGQACCQSRLYALQIIFQPCPSGLGSSSFGKGGRWILGWLSVDNLAVLDETGGYGWLVHLILKKKSKWPCVMPKNKAGG